METLLDGNIGRLKRRLNLESDQKASFARLLRRMIDPSDPLHSRLFAAARKKLWTPMALSVGLLLLAAALGLRRWVESRLKPKGLFAESTQGRPLDNRPESQSMKILRGVADVFPRYRVVDGRAAPRGRQGYVYASQAFPFATAELTAIMKEDNMYDGTSTYTERSSHFRLYRTTPFSLTNMETLLDGNIGRLKRRLNLESDQKASFARLLRRMIDPSDPLHSRLFAAARKKLWTPMALSVGLLLLAAALGLRRWVIRRKRLSAI